MKMPIALMVIIASLFIAYLLCPSYTIHVRFQLDRLLLVLLGAGVLAFLLVTCLHRRVALSH